MLTQTVCSQRWFHDWLFFYILHDLKRFNKVFTSSKTLRIYQTIEIDKYKAKDKWNTFKLMKSTLELIMTMITWLNNQR